MLSLPAHGVEHIQELVSRIVRAVLEDHGAPEQDVEPLTHEVPCVFRLILNTDSGRR